MKIGVIGAMDVEVAALKKDMNITRTTTKAGMTFCEGSFAGTDAVVVQSGIGKVNAALCVQILVDEFAITHLLNTGVAGSLCNDINIGDIVVSTDAVYHDVDATIFGYAKGEVPQMGRLSFPADDLLRQAAVAAVGSAAPEVRAFEGRVVSGDQFIASHEKKVQIAEEFQGLCCEMEGCAIAQAAFVNHLPFVIIRAISDKADESVSVSYEEFEGKAAEHCAHIVSYLLTHLQD